MKHLSRAETRLRQLEMELNTLADEVRQVPIAEDAAPPEDAAPQAPANGAVPPATTMGPTGAASAASPVADASEEAVEEPAQESGDELGATAPSEQAQAAVDAAQSVLGTPYQWGGTTPGAGFDCSGLTQWAYQQAGIDIPRTADAQAVGPQIPRSALQPGDLAVWDGHVAMVVDENNFIEAGDPVQISPIRETNIGMNFKGFYRPTAA